VAHVDGSFDGVRPPLHREGREHIPQERRAPPLYLSLHEVLRLTEGCNGGPVRLMYTNSTPTHTNNGEQT
jgi:hypothetical protein